MVYGMVVATIRAQRRPLGKKEEKHEKNKNEILALLSALTARSILTSVIRPSVSRSFGRSRCFFLCYRLTVRAASPSTLAHSTIDRSIM